MLAVPLTSSGIFPLVYACGVGGMCTVYRSDNARYSYICGGTLQFAPGHHIAYSWSTSFPMFFHPPVNSRVCVGYVKIFSKDNKVIAAKVLISQRTEEKKCAV